MERVKDLLPGTESFPDYFIKGEESYYVDKTLLIMELAKAGFLRKSPQLILRPRRFGKTLTLSMLRTFFDIRERDKAWMFDGLEISKHKDFCDKYQNKFPVIFLSLKDILASDLKGVLRNICIKFGEELSRQPEVFEHLYEPGLFLACPLHKVDVETIEHIKNGDASSEQVSDGIKTMAKALYGYYGTAPLVLIDEYDDALNSAHGKDYFQELLTLFGDLFSKGLKTNPYLGGAVVTGVLQITKSNIFSGLNNLTVSSVADSDFFSWAFGFTQEEVDQMLGYYGLQGKREIFKDWYDGYDIEGSSVYNPYSISRAVNSCRMRPDKPCQNYWVNTASQELLRRMLASAKEDLELKRIFDQLLEGSSASCEYSTEVIYSEILNSRSTILGTLLLSGYLTLDEERRLKVPNREVRTCFLSLAQEYNREYDEEYLPDLVRAYVQGNPEEAKRVLDDYMRSLLIVRDLIKDHGFLCGLLASIEAYASKSLGGWRFGSNYQERLGYPDLVFWNEAEKRAVVIEEKYVAASGKDPEKRIEACKEEGFAQIHETEYTDIKGYEVTCFVNVYHRHRVYVFKG